MTGPGRPARLGPDVVRRIAGLARIAVDDVAAEELAAELDGILRHLDSLRAVDTGDAEPMHHPLPLADVLRDDAPRPGLATQDALATAPDAADGLFRVPRVRPEADA